MKAMIAKEIERTQDAPSHRDRKVTVSARETAGPLSKETTTFKWLTDPIYV